MINRTVSLLTLTSHPEKTTWLNLDPIEPSQNLLLFNPLWKSNDYARSQAQYRPPPEPAGSQKLSASNSRASKTSATIATRDARHQIPWLRVGITALWKELGSRSST
ncbi:hypothetical protein EMCG_00596 [[Emmonsia] crescens]|uniref:Uncharacterized protein n=1 Tax=[Emmonsia] crescens TaxID=73230 RepID=A0A0G2HTP0_9EURO|nr:hypothetical protein EMCG_00596 [Emmonsia crescens UAMH 3008]